MVPKETLDDLYRETERAELISGKIVRIPPLDALGTTAAEEIFISLRLHARKQVNALALGNGIDFVIAPLPSGRESFSPDVSYLVGPRPSTMCQHVVGSPAFVVEVRRTRDQPADEERIRAAKRWDYFLAGTVVIWDVDPTTESVHVYRSSDHWVPTIYQRGELAEAEPIVPGWRMLVDEMFLG